MPWGQSSAVSMTTERGDLNEIDPRWSLSRQGFQSMTEKKVSFANMQQTKPVNRKSAQPLSEAAISSCAQIFSLLGTLSPREAGIIATRVANAFSNRPASASTGSRSNAGRTNPKRERSAQPTKAPATRVLEATPEHQLFCAAKDALKENVITPQRYQIVSLARKLVKDYIAKSLGDGKTVEQLTGVLGGSVIDTTEALNTFELREDEDELVSAWRLVCSFRDTSAPELADLVSSAHQSRPPTPTLPKEEPKKAAEAETEGTSSKKTKTTAAAGRKPSKRGSARH